MSVDESRAKELLAREREEVESELTTLRGEGPEEGDERIEPGDVDSEALYQDELDAGIAQSLEARLAAVERAEQRLAAGTYGLSTLSGAPIPDERLEAQPTAELTVEEEERRPRAE
jgi:DnaK suppressor protein